MAEKEVAVTSVAALACWVVGLTLVVIGIVSDDAWGALGLYVAGVAGVITIRRCVMAVVHARQDVFDMGRDYERGLMQRNGVTQIH